MDIRIPKSLIFRSIRGKNTQHLLILVIIPEGLAAQGDRGGMEWEYAGKWEKNEDSSMIKAGKEVKGKKGKNSSQPGGSKSTAKPTQPMDIWIPKSLIIVNMK